MATGDITVFEEFSLELSSGVHDLSADTLNFGIVTVAPTAADATPRWGNYSANQISIGGGYTGPVVLTSSLIKAAGVTTLQCTSFIIPQNASGQGSTVAYGVLYNDTATNDEAIAFFELGTIDITADNVVIKFNNAASGASGNVTTVTVL